MMHREKSAAEQTLSLAEQIAQRGALAADTMDALARHANAKAEVFDHNDPHYRAFSKLPNPQKYQMLKAAALGANITSMVLEFIKLSGLTLDDMHLLETGQGRVCVKDFYIEGMEVDEPLVEWMDTLARYSAIAAENHERQRRRTAFFDSLLSSEVCQRHPEAYAKTREAVAEAEQRENEAAARFDTHFRMFQQARKHSAQASRGDKPSHQRGSA